MNQLFRTTVMCVFAALITSRAAHLLAQATRLCRSTREVTDGNGRYDFRGFHAPAEGTSLQLSTHPKLRRV